jgi:DNA-binding response OmpR family regulator
MMNASVSILLVDDEPLLRRATALLLSNRGGAVVAASSPDEAVALAAQHLYDVAILDVSAASDASDLLQRMRAGGHVPRRVIVVCDRATDLAAHPEVVTVLQKPYAFDRLLVAVLGARACATARPGLAARARGVARARVSARAPRRALRAEPGRG